MVVFKYEVASNKQAYTPSLTPMTENRVLSTSGEVSCGRFASKFGGVPDFRLQEACEMPHESRTAIITVLSQDACN